MIKINLLPDELKEKAKKSVAVDKMFIGSIAVLIIALVIIIAKINLDRIAYNDLSQEVEKKRAEKIKYTNEVNLINELKNEQEKLQRRVALINGLKKNRFSWAHILDNTAYLIDSNNLNIWFNYIHDYNSSGTIGYMINGWAYSNDDIARYLNELQKSPYVTEVILQSSSLMEVEKREVLSFFIKVTSSFSFVQPTLVVNEKTNNLGK